MNHTSYYCCGHQQKCRIQSYASEPRTSFYGWNPTGLLDWLRLRGFLIFQQLVGNNPCGRGQKSLVPLGWFQQAEDPSELWTHSFFAVIIWLQKEAQGFPQIFEPSRAVVFLHHDKGAAGSQSKTVLYLRVPLRLGNVLKRVHVLM